MPSKSKWITVTVCAMAKELQDSNAILFANSHSFLPDFDDAADLSCSDNAPLPFRPRSHKPIPRRSSMPQLSITESVSAFAKSLSAESAQSKTTDDLHISTAAMTPPNPVGTSTPTSAGTDNTMLPQRPQDVAPASSQILKSFQPDFKLFSKYSQFRARKMNPSQDFGKDLAEFSIQQGKMLPVVQEDPSERSSRHQVTEKQSVSSAVPTQRVESSVPTLLGSASEDSVDMGVKKSPRFGSRLVGWLTTPQTPPGQGVKKSEINAMSPTSF